MYTSGKNIVGIPDFHLIGRYDRFTSRFFLLWALYLTFWGYPCLKSWISEPNSWIFN